MSFGLTLSHRLLTALECSACHQLMDPDRAMETTTEVALFGAKKYAWCPICHQEVQESQWTPAYKRRWTMEWKKSHRA
jgi:hypothetical protein